MANLLTDNFNRANSDTVGPLWTERGAAGVDYDIVTNAAEAIATGSGRDVFHSAVFSTADYTVQFDFIPVLNSDYVGIVGRRVNNGATDSDGYFLLLRNTGTNHLALWRRQAGVNVELGIYIVDVTEGQTYALKLSMQGTTIKGSLDGVERISVTNGDITAAGDAAGGLLSGVVVGCRWDNATVDDFGVAVFPDMWHPAMHQPQHPRIEFINY